MVVIVCFMFFSVFSDSSVFFSHYLANLFFTAFLLLFLELNSQFYHENLPVDTGSVTSLILPQFLLPIFVRKSCNAIPLSKSLLHKIVTIGMFPIFTLLILKISNYTIKVFFLPVVRSYNRDFFIC